MSTCNLKLYKTGLKESLNFAFDDPQDFLNMRSTGMMEISDFQYQRYTLYKTIKINASQVMAEKRNARQFDYAVFRIANTETPVDYFYYYYFITKVTQNSENTITLDLKMDVLNTYPKVDNYVDTDLGYKLSAKTIVNREHKDRFLETAISYEAPVIKPLTGSRYQDVEDLLSMPPQSATADFIIKADIIRSFVQENDVIGIGGFYSYEDSGELDSFSVYDGATFISFPQIVFTPEYMVLRTKLGVPIQFIPYPEDNNIVIKYRVGSPADNIVVYKVEFNAGDYDDFFFPEGELNNTINSYMEFKPYLRRVIDKFQEGVETYLFKRPEEFTLYDKDETNLWKVIYSSTNSVVPSEGATASTYVNPVKINLVSDIATTITAGSPTRVTITPRYKEILNYVNMTEFLELMAADMSNDAYIEILGTQYSKADIIAAGHAGIYLERENPSDLVFKEIRWVNKVGIFSLRGGLIASNVDSVIFYDVEKVREKIDQSGNFNIAVTRNYVYIGSQASTESGVTDTWEDVDLTDPKLIKAIEFPYCPVDFLLNPEVDNIPSGWSYNSTNHLIQLDKIQTNSFDRNINFNESPFDDLKFFNDYTIAYNLPRKIEFESKLFHSDFHLVKFVYDSFSFPFRLENISINNFLNKQDFSIFQVRYVVSKNIQSKFMFQFNQYVCDREVEDYNNILIVDRNNEVALYNNAFINYIKAGGFTYDSKKNGSQQALNGVLTAFSIIGATASFISAAVGAGGVGIAAGIGFTTGAISSIASSIHTAQQQDKALSQKMLQLQNQSMSVSGTEDIDILRAFSGNKAKLVRYELTDVMKQALWDLFYYCGYATHEQKVPNLYTRNNFNFCQADIVFENYPFSEDIAEEVKQKWKEGITQFHLLPNDTYDVEQHYENFELFLM